MNCKFEIFLRTEYLSSANISMQNFHTPRDLWRGVRSNLNICYYNLQSSCTEKEISGLIRHCTQILVFLSMFNNHCQHFICKNLSKLPKVDIQHNRCISISLDKFIMQPDCYFILHDCIVTYSSSFYNDLKNSWQ